METKTDSLKVGDEVKWLTTRATRSGFSFSTKRGTIIALRDIHADVRIYSGGRSYTIARRDLVPITQPSPVTEVFKALTGTKEATP